jgi:hypothetical protein
MKKMLSMMVVGALVMVASFVSADPKDAIRPPDGVRQIWACQCEDKAKLDKTFRDLEDEAAKLVDTMFEQRRQPPRSF